MKKKKRSALPVHANNPRAAFTLAEVLITLTIIGVVSALTIPTLVQKTNKQEYVSALQKAYSTLSQAANMIIAEEGSPKGEEGWAQDNEAVYQMFKKYLVNAKECGTEAGCLAPAKYKYLNGGTTGTNWNTNASMYKLVLADGITINFGETYKTCDKGNLYGNGSLNWCSQITVDLNGIKEPNTFGRDIFMFVLKENGLFPSGCDIDNLCSKEHEGRACACKVLREGRMDY